MQPEREHPWLDMAVTKFRAPVGRADLVLRAELIERLSGYLDDSQIILLNAAGGSGKTMLLAQALHVLSVAPARQTIPGAGAEYVWLSLDEGDNDVNRLLVAILRLLRDVQLEWGLAPEIIASQSMVAEAQIQAVIASIVNALSSYGGERLLMILDDVQRVTDPAALRFLGVLIDSMPPEICVILASRVAPTLPLARWRIKKGLREFSALDLGLTIDEARVLADRQGGQFSGVDVARILQRTSGWMAGFQLMLSVCANVAPEALCSFIEESADRHLFEYFAQEILGELSEPLRKFMLECSILQDLTPARCAELTGREDAHEILQELMRRNLFVSILDERIPVLRFHDLFSEFLQNQLKMETAERVRALHANAAMHEPVPTRAVAHWLAAQAWGSAVLAMHACSRELLAQGGTATLLRWISQLPKDVYETDPHVLFMGALCVLQQWNFPQAIQLLELACRRYAESGMEEAALQCRLILPRVCASVGRKEKARHYIDLIDPDSLPEPLRVIHASSLFWLGMLTNLEDCAEPLACIAAAVERDPSLLLPATENLFVGLYNGIRNTQNSMRRIREACRNVLAQGATHWQLEVNATMVWPEIWSGDQTQINDALQRNDGVTRKLGMVIFNAHINALHAEGVVAIFRGEVDLARERFIAVENGFRTMAPGMSMSWSRLNLHLVAHAHWVAGDLRQLELVWPRLSAPGSEIEWPVVNTCRAQLKGRLAYLRGDFAQAEEAFSEAMDLQRSGFLPMFCGDSRFSLAMSCLAQGKREAASRLLVTLMEIMLAEDSVGALLMEPVAFREPLMDALPHEMRARPDVQRLLARARVWTSLNMCGPSRAKEAGVLRSLSQRELDVLARIAAGDSNKMIAGALALSTYTVKNHVANILAKLGCASRGQAAVLWRDTQS